MKPWMNDNRIMLFGVFIGFWALWIGTFSQTLDAWFMNLSNSTSAAHQITMIHNKEKSQ